MSETLTIGAVAARSGVPVTTLHFYETKGLLQSSRTPGNQRRYPRDVLRRIAVIKVAQKSGISLQEISRALATLPANRTPTKADWTRLSTTWQATLENRIQRLTRLKNQLDQCIGCGCLSLQACPMINPNDDLAKQGQGPRLLDP